MPAHTFSDSTFYILKHIYEITKSCMHPRIKFLLNLRSTCNAFEIVRKRIKMESEKRTRKMIMANTSSRMNDDDHQLNRKMFVEKYTRPMHAIVKLYTGNRQQAMMKWILRQQKTKLNEGEKKKENVRKIIWLKVISRNKKN